MMLCTTRSATGSAHTGKVYVASASRSTENWTYLAVRRGRRRRGKVLTLYTDRKTRAWRTSASRSATGARTCRRPSPVWSLAAVQTCIIHLNWVPSATPTRQYWDEMSPSTTPPEVGAKNHSRSSPQSRPIYTIVIGWGERLERVRALTRLDVEICRVICTTCAIE